MRHICGISGGRDSTACALHLRNTRPELDIEYYFSDTGAERPGTYETIDKLEDVLGKPIVRLKAERDMFEKLVQNGGMMPNHHRRWCTAELKIKPFEKYVGSDLCTQYVGIRADERKRVNTARYPKNIAVEYPLIDDGINLEGVKRILSDNNVEMPEFYKHFSRSGCFMCFYQRTIEWVKLSEHYPELFQRAVDLENGIIETNSGERYNMARDNPNWSRFNYMKTETLVELHSRRDAIVARHERAMRRAAAREAQMELQFDAAVFEVEETCPEVGWCDR